MKDDTISRQAAIDTIDEIESEVADGDGFQYEKWKQYFCDLPSADIDLSDYSDRLWRNAYERGKADAEAEIIHCRDCKWYDITHPYGTVNPDAHHCKANDRFYDETHFCGYGERRNDADNSQI